MVRLRRLIAALALVFAASTTASAPAQSLQRLTVQSFTLSADTNAPHVEVPFHLIVALNVRERVTEIDNLDLPILAELELLGDVRRVSSGANGTQYREVITVVAHHTGAIALAPATLQAVDARDGKPKQWFTNPLTIEVAGSPMAPLQNGARAAAAAGWFALRLALWAFGLLCALAIVVLLFRRGRRTAPVAAAPAVPVDPAPPPPPRSRRNRLRDVLTVLRADPTRANAVRGRATVWEAIGASDGETLGDVLVRPAAADPGMRGILIALERAAFTYDDDLPGAIHDACNAMEQYLA